jgi:hypothetical protein
MVLLGRGDVFEKRTALTRWYRFAMNQGQVE